MTVLCIGEPLIVLTPPIGIALSRSDSCEVGVAGAELNVAVHLARMGLPVRYAAAVGDDPFGERITAMLQAEGVDCTALVADPERPTGIYFKDHQSAAVHYYRAGSAASAHLPTTALLTDDLAAVHLTGVSAALNDEQARAALDLLHAARGQAMRSFDVNFRAALWAAEDASPVLTALALESDLVFVGLDEAQSLWGCRDADEVRARLAGVPELVVKCGSGPAHIWAGSDPVSVPALHTEVVEPVGAGDAFASAYLAARLAGHSPTGAAERGHLLAAAVLRSTSDQGERADPAYGRLSGQAVG